MQQKNPMLYRHCSWIYCGKWTNQDQELTHTCHIIRVALGSEHASYRCFEDQPSPKVTMQYMALCSGSWRLYPCTSYGSWNTHPKYADWHRGTAICRHEMWSCGLSVLTRCQILRVAHTFCTKMSRLLSQLPWLGVTTLGRNILSFYFPQSWRQNSYQSRRQWKRFGEP